MSHDHHFNRVERIAVATGGVFLGYHVVRAICQFLVMNAVELILLVLLAAGYNSVTHVDQIKRVVSLAQPNPSDLVVEGAMATPRSGSTMYKLITLTLVNRSPAAIRDVRFRCAYSETVQDAYENRRTEERVVWTDWALTPIEPGMRYNLLIPANDVMPANQRLRCAASFDHFDLGRRTREAQ